MIIIGTFIRGPGWQWFWPGQTWDHNRLIYEVNRDLPDIFGITSNLGKGNFGAIVVGGYYLLGGGAVYSLFRRKMPKDFQRMSLLQFSHHGVSMADHDCVAFEDGSAPLVAHQVRMDYAVVQHMKRLKIANWKTAIASPGQSEF